MEELGKKIKGIIENGKLDELNVLFSDSDSKDMIQKLFINTNNIDDHIVYLAIQKGNLKILESIFKNFGANILFGAQYLDDHSYISYAIELSKNEILRKLINIGAKVNLPNNNTYNIPLHTAILANNATAIEIIIDDVRKNIQKYSNGEQRFTHSQHIRYANISNGNNAIHLAASADNSNILQYILNSAEDISSKLLQQMLQSKNDKNKTPLEIALELEDNDNKALKLELLLSKISKIDNPKAKSNISNSLINDVDIHFAAAFYDARTVAALCRYPNLINKKDKFGYTPLHIAVIHNNFESCQTLLANKADLNVISADLGDYEVASDSLPPYLKNKTYNFGSPLQIALSSQNINIDIIHLLLDNRIIKISTQWHNSRRENLLQLVAKSGNKQVFDKLLDHLSKRNMLDLDDVDKNMNTPLLIATEYGNTDIVIKLLELGADVEHRNAKNENALHIATKNNHKILVDLLLSNIGSHSCSVLNSDKLSPLDLAYLDKKSKVLLKLQEYFGKKFRNKLFAYLCLVIITSTILSYLIFSHILSLMLTTKNICIVTVSLTLIALFIVHDLWKSHQKGLTSKNIKNLHIPEDNTVSSEDITNNQAISRNHSQENNETNTPESWSDISVDVT
ncbi:MAG: ankyrin repeat domain-containing protein [Pseudomonadota bacterium]|nr:ankyrin repeat domain-containing protein [Pseudomonadota bacterium]